LLILKKFCFKKNINCPVCHLKASYICKKNCISCKQFIRLIHHLKRMLQVPYKVLCCANCQWIFLHIVSFFNRTNLIFLDLKNCVLWSSIVTYCWCKKKNTVVEESHMCHTVAAVCPRHCKFKAPSCEGSIL
jgi:hypothetical protein